MARLLCLFVCSVIGAPVSPEDVNSIHLDDNWQVIAGSSIGEVHLGQSGVETLGLLGRVTSSYNAISGLYTQDFGALTWPGGAIRLTFEHGAVVQISASSSRYRTEAGLSNATQASVFIAARPDAASHDCVGGHVLDDVAAGLALRQVDGQNALIVHLPGHPALDEAAAASPGPAAVASAGGNPCEFAAPRPQLLADAYGKDYLFARAPHNISKEIAKMSDTVTLEIASNSCVDGVSTAYTFRVSGRAGAPNLQQALGEFSTLLGGVKFEDASAMGRLKNIVQAWNAAPPRGREQGFAQCTDANGPVFKSTADECRSANFDTFAVDQVGDEVHFIVTHSVGIE